MLIRLARRLGWGLATLLGTAAIVFALMHLSGDPAVMYAGEKADQETVERIRKEMGLDRPVPVQFAAYVGRAARGDLGMSTFHEGESVTSLIVSRLPYTLALALAGLAIWVGVGVPIGVYTSTRHRQWPDRLALLVAVVSLSLPTFWLGRMLQHQLAYSHALFPVGSVGSPAHIVLPAVTLGFAGVGYYMRLVHANMLEVLPSEYVRTARAKGLSERAVVWRHAFRNAMLPVVTVLGLDAAKLLSGVIFTEMVFAWPGIGSLAVRAISYRDIPVVMGTVLFSATLVVAANLIVDVLYRWMDPRIRDGGGGA